MFKQFFLFGLICLAFQTQAQNKPAKAAYQFDVNVGEVKDGKIMVTLHTPKLYKDSLTYHIPKMVPGTYHIYDYGRFIQDFKALDDNNKELKVNRTNPDSWVIYDAQKMATITYWVEDTWHSHLDNHIFEPGGTNIEKGKNIMMNTFGFFGYFEGFQQIPYYVNATHPKNFYGSTSLQRIGGSQESDTYFAETYNYLADGPIMFCEPDTTWITVGGAKVLISVYSPNKKVTSKYLAAQIGPTLDCQRQYLDGKLPVDHYSFLLYLADKPFLSGSYGALEHSFSSMYCLMETDEEGIAQIVKDVSAHEFFHIVTPLSIHSEEIQYFDFYQPKMSQHLWLYEGQTEYAAHHAQVRCGQISIEHFMEKMTEKMEHAETFNTKLPITEMSKGCLDKYEKQYQNVYEQGALISMCLDLKLRALSDGKTGIRDLIRNLSAKYGKDKPFKDDELFDVIVSLTHKDIKDFINDHIKGAKPLPYKKLLSKVGVKYKKDGYLRKMSPLGGLENGALGFDYTEMRLKVSDEKLLDDFGKNVMGLKTDDLLISIDGNQVDAENAQNTLMKYITTAKEGKETVWVIKRKGKEMTLKFKLNKIKIKVKYLLEIDPKPSKKEMALRKAWLGDYKTEDQQ